MEDSEYFVQIFLFVATILCYILLTVFVFYGIYHCCIRACILRITRKQEEDEGDNEKVPNSENHSYCRHVRLLYPFQRDEKKAVIVANSKSFKNTTTTSAVNDDVDDSINIPISNTLDEQNPFIDKKYYDIFHA